MWRALRRHRRLGRYWLEAQPCRGPLRHRGLAALTVDDGYHCFSFPSEGWDVTICEVGFRIEFSPWRVEIFCRACRGPLRCRGWISGCLLAVRWVGLSDALRPGQTAVVRPWASHRFLNGSAQSRAPTTICFTKPNRPKPSPPEPSAGSALCDYHFCSCWSPSAHTVTDDTAALICTSGATGRPKVAR